MENQINQRMFANVTEEYSFRIVDRALPAGPSRQGVPEQGAVPHRRRIARLADRCRLCLGGRVAGPPASRAAGVR